MPRQGTPLAGLTEIGKRVYVDGAALTLVCYTNTQDSLGPDTVASDLTQPDEDNGYAPIVLDGTWVTTDGVCRYTHPAGADADGAGNPIFLATDTWSAVVTGVAMIYGSAVLHFMDLRDGEGTPTTFTAAAGNGFKVDINNLTATT